MPGLRSVFITILKVNYMRIAKWLKQFQNVTALNLSIVLTKFCAHAMYKAKRKLSSVWPASAA